MDTESPPSMDQYDRIDSWLTSGHYVPLTPPPNDDSKLHPVPLKRKRAMSLPASVPTSTSHRSDSPKRRRTEDADDVQPEQSVSQSGSEALLALNDRNTFSPPASRVSSSPKRPSSPTRETPIILRSAWPPVLTESLNGLKEDPPEHAERLGDRLADGIDSGFIPQGLQVCTFRSRCSQIKLTYIQHIIKNDPDVGYQTIKMTDFDRNDKRSIEELAVIWKEAKKIFLNARNCKDGSRDENAWCDDVVRPLVHLAMDLYGNGKWWFQSVYAFS